MPRVPGAVQADTNMMPFRMDGPSIEMAALPGRQQQQMGQALMGLGSVGMQIATDMQQEANRVQVMAAQNRARAAANELSFGNGGFYGIKGEAAVNPPDKMPLVDSYTDRLRQSISDVQDGLGNDVQKQAFAVWRDSFETEFRSQVQRHQLSEFKAHQVSTYKGAVELGVEEATRNWSNPERVRAAIDGLQVPGDEQTRYGGVRQAAYQWAKAAGKSENEATYEAKKAASGSHLSVLTQALGAKQVSYAKKYLDENKGDMLENDVLKINEHLTQHLDTNLAMLAVGATVRDYAGKFQPTSMDRLNGIVLGLESGGRDTNADGTPLTSPKGAKYAMQVMPATAKDPGFGIKPAADDSAAEYNRVGREYLSALVKQYGNVGQVLGAYNAGPGAMDEAIKKAKAEGRPESWAAYLPAETQAYVRNGLAKYGAGGGAPAMPTEFEFVEAAIAKLGPSPSPEATKMARTAAEHQYGVITKSIKAQEDNAVAEGMRWLESNGGRFSELPPALKAAIPPKEYDNLRGYSQKVAKGDDVTSPALYQKLAADTAYLKGMSDDAFYRLRTELSESDFKHFANERAKLISGKGGDSAQDLNTSAINMVLNDRLRSMGEDPTPKDSTPEAAKLGEMRKFIRESILNAQATTGKKMTDLDVEKHIDGLFAKSVGFQTTFLGINSGRTSQMLMGMKPGDIPSDVRDRIKLDFRNNGIENPTDAQLLGVYWRLKNKR